MIPLRRVMEMKRREWAVAADVPVTFGSKMEDGQDRDCALSLRRALVMSL